MLRAHDGGLAVNDLAPALGLHPNTVRAHLDVLTRTGHVSRRTDARNTPGRPRDLYEATGAATSDRNYQLLARVLASRLTELSEDPTAEAVEAGRRWSEHEAVGEPAGIEDSDATGARGSELVGADVGTPLADRDALAPVLRMLKVSGFAPQLSPDASAIQLHHCPFRELAEEHPGIVCGAHLGLIQGALVTSGANITATRILPFVRPDLCLAELTRGDPGNPGARPR